MFYLLSFFPILVITTLSQKKLEENAPVVLRETKDLRVWIDTIKERCGAFTTREELDTCYRSILAEVVKVEGTVETVEVLELLRGKGVIDAKFDDHQHVHKIGRATAELKGLNVDAFLSCPSTAQTLLILLPWSGVRLNDVNAIRSF